MDAQRSLNITIDDTSPIIRYQPLSLFTLDTVPDPLTGWSPICGAKTWVCDDHSAHTTSFDGAKFALSFFGTGIYLFGNVTSGMSYELTIDENGVSNGLNGNNDTEPQMLARVSSLKPAVHTLTLVVKKGNSNGLFTFDYAQVIVDSATSFERTILNGTSSSRLTYGPAEPQYLQSWSSYGAYNATVPDGVDFNTFKASDLLGANVYTSFSGNTLLYYGPCYAASGAYTVTIDGSPNSQPVQLNASVPYTPVIARCLRYYAGGLSTNSSAASSQIQHELLITNSQEKSWMTVHWLEIWNFELGGGSPSASSSAATRIHRGIVVDRDGSSFALLIILFALIRNLFL